LSIKKSSVGTGKSVPSATTAPKRKPNRTFHWKSFSIAALRKASYRTPMRNACLKNARVGRNEYLCSHCSVPDSLTEVEQELITQYIKTQTHTKELQLLKDKLTIFGRKDINVDHVVPVVSVTNTQKDQSLDTFAERLYCEVDGLQVLCKPCHTIKTNEEKVLRKSYKDKRNEDVD